MRTDAAAVTAAKKKLRVEMIAQRARLDTDLRAGAAQALAAAAGRIAPAAPGVVSGFVAIGDEIDPAPLLAALHRLGSALALPVMVGRGRPLVFRSYQPGDHLRTVTWGIREPTDDKPLLAPDLLLLPLLAFDARGHRLGYGGGFYDRTLREARADRVVRAIGIAFDEQYVDAVPHLDYDEPLDAILTPSRLVLPPVIAGP